MRKFCIYCLLALPVFASFLFVPNTHAQRHPEIKISAGEDFFDAVLDAALSGPDLLEFSISAADRTRPQNEIQSFLSASYSSESLPSRKRLVSTCREVITLRREGGGGKTAVRFRDGRIFAPLSFTGQYNPPFIGCVQFGGVADTELTLEFEPETRGLVARVRVLNVNLEGSGGVGGNVVARLVQSSIDRKVNPIKIISLDKLSFLLPLQPQSQLRLTARNIRAEVLPGRIELYVGYEIAKLN
ncbi:MAG: hypothetical protein C4324_00395 [Blastocatellia bacterium]